MKFERWNLTKNDVCARVFGDPGNDPFQLLFAKPVPGQELEQVADAAQINVGIGLRLFFSCVHFSYPFQ